MGSAFDLAFRNVERDWYRVFGHKPFVYTLEDYISEWNNKATITSQLDDIMLFGNALDMAREMEQSSSDAHAKLSQRVQNMYNNVTEGHSIRFFSVENQNSHDGAKLLNCLASVGTGGETDELGMVYALYQFSDSILGIDPQAYWTNHDEGIKTRPFLRVPLNITFDSGTPTFRFRGVFVNDEDVLGGLARDPMDQSVFNVPTWDRYMETVLRQKGNIILPGTCSFMDEVHLELATRRGLYITQHHFALLGTNMFQWPQGLPYNVQNLQVLKQVWQTQVAYTLKQGYKMIYTLGFRGKNDYPFWYDNPSFDTDVKRGALISRVISLQSQIINDQAAKTGKEKNVFYEKITYIWAEMNGLYQRGLLDIPSDVHVALSDDSGTGLVDPVTIGLIEPHQGLYYHVMMVHDQYGNQLTEKVSPARAYSQIRRFVDKKATYMLLINTSDLRDVPLSFAALMDYAWRGPNRDNLSPKQQQDEFLRHWTKRQYDIENERAVQMIADAYADYFDIPYMATPSLDGLPVGDQFIILNLRRLAQSLLNSDNATETQLLAQRCLDVVHMTSVSHTQQLSNHVRFQVLPLIPLKRVVFFQQHLLIQSDIHCHVSTALYLLARAVVEKDQDTVVWDLIKLAHDHVAILQKKLLADGEAASRWSGWYLYDSCNDLIGAIEYVSLLHYRYYNRVGSAIPELHNHHHALLAHSFESGTKSVSPEFRYEKARDNFPFFHDHKETGSKTTKSIGNLVLVLCSPDSSMPCIETPGGCSFEFVPGGRAQLTLRALHSRSLHGNSDARIEYEFVPPGNYHEESSCGGKEKNSTAPDGSQSVPVMWNGGNTTFITARLMSFENKVPMQVETRAMLALKQQ